MSDVSMREDADFVAACLKIFPRTMAGYHAGPLINYLYDLSNFLIGNFGGKLEGIKTFDDHPICYILGSIESYLIDLQMKSGS